MYVRRGDGALLQSLNEAIVILIGNGEIERIYRRYGIWDEQQAELAAIAADSRFFGLAGAVRAVAKPAAAPAAAASVSAGPAGSASAGPAGAARAAPAGAAMPSEQVVKTSGRKRGWQVVTTYAGVMLKSAGLTVVLSALSFPLAVLVGLLIAVGRLYGPRWLRTVLTAYVELLRGTPVMLQLYFIFFFLPEVGVVVPAFWTGIVGLAVNYSAYESEIYRAGLQAVPRGQMEAALSLGMSRALAVRRIVVPQAVRIVIPPVVNDFIALFKDTSVCSVVTLVELTKRFSVLSQSTQSTPELMAMTAALYMAMSYPLAVLSRWVERRLGVETKL
ncbi:MAG: ABC transporter substrate-binding protein/permease [Deltaproteobacteria bacterium]|nr:ABC transporter substrate-binding protein/permease [Deltaproteobacteria bacterium]